MPPQKRLKGKNAPGGTYSYLVKGKMIGGFSLVAYPAKYGVSGIMTLIVNHDGVVYEKDLGKKTEAFVKAMTTFDPDKTWRKVEGKHLEPSVSSKRGGKSLNAFLRRLPVPRLSSQ